MPRATAVAIQPGHPDAGPAGRHPAGGAGRRPRGRGPGEGGDRPSLRALAGGFARLFLEVEAGCRPAAQLGPLMDRRLYARLERHWVRGGPPGRLVHVTGALTAPGRYDAVAVLRRGDRWGALALRLTRRRGSWVVEQAGRPEDGPLPEPDVPVPGDEPDVFDLVCAPAGLVGARRGAQLCS